MQTNRLFGTSALTEGFSKINLTLAFHCVLGAKHEELPFLPLLGMRFEESEQDSLGPTPIQAYDASEDQGDVYCNRVHRKINEVRENSAISQGLHDRNTGR